MGEENSHINSFILAFIIILLFLIAFFSFKISGNIISNERWKFTQKITTENFAAGYEKVLDVDGRVSFDVDGETYFIGLREVNRTFASFETSIEKELILNAGESKKINFNSDGFYDTELILDYIGGNKANIRVIKVSEQISDNELVNEVESEPKTEQEKKSFDKNFWILLVLIILFVLFMKFYIKRSFNRK
ncbi:MAG: hypothetical protein AABY22_09195 [Nanoarchaeota archaeon]